MKWPLVVVLVRLAHAGLLVVLTAALLLGEAPCAECVRLVLKQSVSSYSIKSVPPQ